MPLVFLLAHPCSTFLSMPNVLRRMIRHTKLNRLVLTLSADDHFNHVSTNLHREMNFDFWTKKDT